MKHFHNYTVPRCNSNYSFEDSDDSPVRHRAEIKDDTARETRESNEGAKGEKKSQARGKKEGEGEISLRKQCVS